MKLPVFLGRRPDEPADVEVQAFYHGLVRAIRTPALRGGHWRLCTAAGWPDNQSCNNLVAWSWHDGDDRRLIVVNLSEQPSQARIQVVWPDLAGQDWSLEDQLSGARYMWAGDEMLNAGVFVDLPPWGYHFLAVK